MTKKSLQRFFGSLTAQALSEIKQTIAKIAKELDAKDTHIVSLDISCPNKSSHSSLRPY